MGTACGCQNCGLVTPYTCVESQAQHCCMNSKSAFPCTKDVPMEIGLYGCMCMGSTLDPETKEETCCKTACCCSSCFLGALECGCNGTHTTLCVQQGCACPPTEEIPCEIALFGFSC